MSKVIQLKSMRAQLKKKALNLDLLFTDLYE